MGFRYAGFYTAPLENAEIQRVLQPTDRRPDEEAEVVPNNSGAITSLCSLTKTWPGPAPPWKPGGSQGTALQKGMLPKSVSEALGPPAALASIRKIFIPQVLFCLRIAYFFAFPALAGLCFALKYFTAASAQSISWSTLPPLTPIPPMISFPCDKGNPPPNMTMRPLSVV